MRTYKRVRIEGGCYFFTLVLADRSTTLLVDHVADLREAFRSVRRAHPFDVDAIVVLPDHLHCVWTLPEGDADFSTRWRLIKTRFSRAIAGNEVIVRSRRRKSERGIWQRRYWEHAIRDDEDFARHLDHIHYNPVKHGYAASPVDWPHSSFPKWVRAGAYPVNWAAGDEIKDWDRE